MSANAVPAPASPSCASVLRRGFTLIEMLVTIAIISLMVGLVLGLGDSILPQSRLEASATMIGGALDAMRSYALFAHQEILFVYDFEQNEVAAYFPYESDSEGVPVGPGRTIVMDPKPLEDGMDFMAVRMPDGSLREREPEVALTISPLGKITPHDVIVYNPEYPDIEVLTVRVSGLTNRYEIFDGTPSPEGLQDVDFR